MRTDTILLIVATVLVAAVGAIFLLPKFRKEGYWEYQRYLDGLRYTQERALRSAVPLPLGPYVYEPSYGPEPVVIPVQVPMPQAQHVDLPGYSCHCTRTKAMPTVA